jgi:hypothetical protein
LTIESASPPTFNERGTKLHSGLIGMRDFNAAEVVQIEEICRMADRLEAIEELVASKGLANLLHLRRMDDAGEEQGEVVIKVTIDAVLAEGRQLQLAFQRSVAALKLDTGAAAEAEVDLGDDLARQRADRIARAAG